MARAAPFRLPAWISQSVIEPSVEQTILAKLRAEVRVNPKTDEIEQAERPLDQAEAELKAMSKRRACGHRC